MSGCSRRASENVARRISPFCTAQLVLAKGDAAALNESGGYARAHRNQGQ
jgi:hypothetical protein